MKRLLVILFIAITCNVMMQAQNQDVIYLNNGNVVKGKIIDSKPNVSVRIETTDGKQYEYLMTEIRQISGGDVITPKDPGYGKYVHYSEYKSGYWVGADLLAGGSIMHGKKNVGFTQLSVINGYRFSDFLKVGVGLGARYYIENSNRRVKSSEWSFPVYLDLRGNFTSQRINRIAPFWAFDTGVAITDGFFFSPTLGVKFGGERSNFLIGISYMGQNFRTFEESNGDFKKAYELNHLLSLRLGYEF